MFTAKVYKVMVGSLSGTMEEVLAAKETIRKWNMENADRIGKMYLSIDCSAKSEAIQDVDVVIGIVGNWIENTDLIEDCIKNGKQVMLFFNAFQDPNNTMPSEHKTVMAFRRKMQHCCSCAEYNSIDDLCRVIYERLVSIQMVEIN